MEKVNLNEPDVLTFINQSFLINLEENLIPWHFSWAKTGIPINIFSTKAYKGVNVWLLLMHKFELNVFLTEDQITKLGGSIVKQAEPNLIITMNYEFHVDLSAGKGMLKEILNPVKVYNVSQCTGIPPERLPEWNRIINGPLQECQLLVDLMPKPPMIIGVEEDASYDPNLDFVFMPPVATFLNPEIFYYTLFKQLICSTFHSSRANFYKEFLSIPKQDRPIMETLVADIGACHLLWYARVEKVDFPLGDLPLPDWIQKIKENKIFFYNATIYAQAAVDYILRNRRKQEPGKLQALH
jgi:antirestriction protein ArdC